MKITVQLKPRAKEEKLEKVDDFNFKVWVKEPPIENRANFALARIMADYFEVPLNQIKIIGGVKSKIKILDIARTPKLSCPPKL